MLFTTSPERTAPTPRVSYEDILDIQPGARQALTVDGEWISVRDIAWPEAFGATAVHTHVAVEQPAAQTLPEIVVEL